MKWRAVTAFAFGLVAMAPQGQAAEYPTLAIKLVVPYAAGGPTDVLGRLVGDYLGRDLKQTVVVENKAGAQGAIGAEAAARSEPDGYTLFFTAASIFVVNPLLYKKLSYDPTRDFRLLAVVTDLPVVMEVHPSVPAKTVAEFVAYAKQNPGKLNFGSAGTGGTIHLAGEMFKQMAGVDMVHVAYKGAGPALTDLISGNIQLMFDTLGTACRRSRAACCGRSRFLLRSAFPTCPMSRPWPRAAIRTTASASGMASLLRLNCLTTSRRNSSPV